MKLNLAHRALLIMALFSACTENAIQLETAKQDTPTNNRTLEEILDIAKNAPTTFEENDTRSAQTSKEIDMSSLKAIPCKSTRSGEGINSSLYVINYANNEGYAIISAKQGTPGVIAYIDEGQYNMADIQNSNTNIGLLTDLATAYVANASWPLKPVPNPEYSDTMRIQYNPLISTKWGQDYPEGTLCPNGIAGCVNTAMAQLCAYYEYPDTIQLSYPGAEQNQLILDWDEIKKHTIRHSMPGFSIYPLCLASDQAHDDLAAFVYQLAELNHSSYGENATSVTAGAVISTAQQLGYLFYDSQTWHSYDADVLTDAMFRRHPLLIAGFDGSAGHMFIADGCKDLHITDRAFLAESGELEVTERRETYHHINWGWDGRCNGYALVDVFKPGNMRNYDSSIYGHVNTNYNFNENVICLEIYRNIGIAPLN